jgi:hypothetical protein
MLQILCLPLIDTSDRKAPNSIGGRAMISGSPITPLGVLVSGHHLFGRNNSTIFGPARGHRVVATQVAGTRAKRQRASINLHFFPDSLLHPINFQAMFVAAPGVGAAMPIRSFVEPGAFDPEAIAAMSEALEAALKKLPDTGAPEVVRERIATRIIAAAKLGERDPARLLEAALREPD